MSAAVRCPACGSLHVSQRDVDECVEHAALPELVQHGDRPLHGGYRLFTRAHGAYDDFVGSGARTVVIHGFSMSTSVIDRVFSSQEVVAADDGMYTLRLRYQDGDKHRLDGTKYLTREDASRAAFAAGALAFMWYEDDRLAQAADVR